MGTVTATPVRWGLPFAGGRRVLVPGLALAGAVLIGACSDGGSGGSGEDPGDDAPVAVEPSPSAVLAERMGCRSGFFTHAPDRGWQEADVHDCSDNVTARIYASLTVPQRDAAVRLLAMEAAEQGDGPDDGCVDFGPYHPELYVIAGDTWVAVVSGREADRDAAVRLDGELQPGSLDVPANSGVGTGCLPGP
jgi:hypothetical protein